MLGAMGVCVDMERPSQATLMTLARVPVERSRMLAGGSTAASAGTPLSTSMLS